MSPCSSSDWRPRRCRVCADALRPEWTHRQTFRANPRARLGSITLSFLRGCCLSGTSSKDNYPVGGENPAFTHAPLDARTRQFVVKGQCARLARGADSVNRWRPRSNLSGISGEPKLVVNTRGVRRVRNPCNDYYRKASPVDRATDPVEEEQAESRTNDHIVEQEAAMTLAVLRTLPDTYRESLTLRLVEGMTGPEIAARMGLTHGSVRVNLHRGMQMLREKLAEKARSAAQNMGKAL